MRTTPPHVVGETVRYETAQGARGVVTEAQIIEHNGEPVLTGEQCDERPCRDVQPIPIAVVSRLEVRDRRFDWERTGLLVYAVAFAAALYITSLDFNVAF